jgi:hypothetical protein
MGKQIRILEQQIGGNENNAPTVQSPKVIDLHGRVVSVAITNMSGSANELIIGWNENPSTKNYLSQGESRVYGPYNDGQYVSEQAIKFAFANVGGGALNSGINQALVIISYETDKEIC